MLTGTENVNFLSPGSCRWRDCHPISDVVNEMFFSRSSRADWVY